MRLKSLIFFTCAMFISLHVASASLLELDVKLRSTFVPHPNKNVAFGPAVNVDVGIFRHFRVGAEGYMPLLFLGDGLPVNLAAYVMIPFPIETGFSTFSPYIALPLGLSVAKERVSILTGVRAGLRWYFTEYFGLVAEGALDIVPAEKVYFMPAVSLGASFRF